MTSLLLETNHRKPAKEGEETTMEDEFEKRNTDCVYFLASPLTCRKGAECEYRHSEIARLNPRDCWYWISGSCLNPTCSFRHPPLEKPTELAPESNSLRNQTAATTNKNDVPCYFYFNGFCNKGDKCLFSHGPDTSTMKYVKSSSAVAGVQLGKKTSVGNEDAPTLKKAHVNPPEVARNMAVDSKPKHVVDSHQIVPRRVIQDPSPEVIVPHHEDEFVVNSSSMLLEGELVHSKTYTPSYQNSEDHVDDYVEPEERLESSPGFDVLVDDKSEYLAYEDDEYLQAIERERRELNSHFLGDDFSDRTEYDPTYPDPEHYFDGEMIGSYDRVDNIRIYDDVGNDYRDKMLNAELSRKRKIHSSDVAINGQRGQDLRDHLRKRRTTDGCGYGADRLGRSGDSSCMTSRSEERHRRNVMSQRLRERLVLHAGNSSAESLDDNGTFSDGGIQRGLIHDTPRSMSRQQFNDRRPAHGQFLPSERQRRSGSRDRRSSEERIAFSTPKTLAQIREEKKKADENGDCIGIMGQSSHIESADFEGPKPLSEILKDKRRPSSVVAGTKVKHLGVSMNHVHLRKT